MRYDFLLDHFGVDEVFLYYCEFFGFGIRRRMRTQENKTMKKLITLLAVVAGGFVLSPVNAEARGHRHESHRPADRVYVSGHSSCGCPVYTKKVFRHYDRHGHAVYTYERQSVNHRCNRYDRHRGHAHNSHSSSNRRSSVSLRTVIGRALIGR